ncbi:ASCH domain-containing protein [Cupriavidus sp. KB_39]|uniref:ASCH domain-containing protein n=1 Tax=Cupriavidus sp. KB_39 TaxID=3233036 RepID=UPI003F93F435
MKDLKPSIRFADDIALISIHPGYVEKIIAGEKNVEFRRRWPNRIIGTLVVYATSPVKRLAVIVEITEVVRASKTALWRISSDEGGGISRQRLFDYLDGKALGVALKLGRRLPLEGGLLPNEVFGAPFHAPQSYRYLTEDEKIALRRCVEGMG